MALVPRVSDSGFGAALQFLTRVPVRTARSPDLATAVMWFPVVGALIGAAVGGIAAGLGELVPSTVAAAVAVLAGVLVTGAFHEDGLADTADAVAGGSTVERRLAILKDPRHGTYGVAALCGSIVLRVIAVASLAPAAAFAGLVATHALARAAAVAVMGAVPATGTGGLGADYTRAVGRGRAAAATVIGVVLAAAATGWWALPLAATAAAAAVLVTGVATRAFGGINGDVLGAVEQVAECAALVTVTGLALHHDVWWS
jgi:adenosylcobinamide-GDP ribazoletransferase